MIPSISPENSKSESSQVSRNQDHSFLGRAWSWWKKEATYVDVAEAAINPGPEKVYVAMRNLDKLASGDKRISSFLEDFIECSLNKLATAAELRKKDPAFYSPGVFDDFYAGLKNDDSSGTSYYLKNFVGHLFHILGKEILNERKSEAFTDAEDLLNAVFKRISDKVMEGLDKIKHLTDEEIQKHAEEVVDYFYNKVSESEDSWLVKFVLYCSKGTLKKGLVDQLTKYYCSYAKIARLADEVRSQPQYQELKPSLEWTDLKVRFQLEKQLHELPINLAGLFENRLEALNHEFFVDVLKKQISDVYANNQSLVDDIQTVILGCFIDLKDQSLSVQQKTSGAARGLLTDLDKEMKGSSRAIKMLHVLFVEAEEEPEDAFKLKNGMIAFMLQNRINMLSKEVEQYKQLKKDYKKKMPKDLDSSSFPNSYWMNQITGPYESLKDHIRHLEEELQKASVQMVGLDKKVSDDELIAMLKPVLPNQETDWSTEFHAICRKGSDLEQLYNLALDITLAPAANKMINKVIEEKYQSNPIIKDIMQGFGVKIAAHYLGNLAHDMHFYNKDLEKESMNAQAALNQMQNGKGQFLLQLLNMLIRSGFEMTENENIENPFLNGSIAPTLKMDNPVRGGKLIDAILRDASYILAFNAMEKTQGATLDDKVETIFKNASDIIDDIFKNFETYKNSPVNKKKKAFEKAIEFDVDLKFFAKLQCEKGLKDETLYDEVCKYYTTRKMSRNLLELFTSEEELNQLLPRVVQDSPVFDSLVGSLAEMILPHFDMMYNTQKLTRDEAAKAYADPKQKKIETLIFQFVLHRMNETAQNQPDMPAAGALSVEILLQHLLMKGGLNAAADKMENAKNSPNILGEALSGIIRRFSKDLAIEMPQLWSDPTFFPKVLVKVSDLTADYLENGVTQSDQNQFVNQDQFIKDFTDKILSLVYPDGADGLPEDESLREASWQKIHDGLKSLIKENLTKLEDKHQRKAFILGLISKQSIDPNLTDDQLNERIEQAVVKEILEQIALRIPKILKSEPIKILLAPLIWIFSWILISRTVHTTRKLLEAMDKDDFHIFLRKMLWNMATDVIEKTNYNVLVDDKENKTLQNNYSRITKQLDIPFPVRYISTPLVTSEMLVDPKMTGFKVLKEMMTGVRKKASGGMQDGQLNNDSDLNAQDT